MFRETLFFKTALYSAYDWLAKIRQLIFCRVPSALQLLSVSAFQNRSRGKSCVVERGAPGMDPFRHFTLRNATAPFCRLAATSSPGRGKSFHSGGGLGKEGRFRPHRSTAGRSLPLSRKLFASAKASPFRERWRGEAVTERELSGRTLSVAYGDSSPKGRALGKEGRSRPHSLTTEEASVKL